MICVKSSLMQKQSRLNEIIFYTSILLFVSKYNHRLLIETTFLSIEQVENIFWVVLRSFWFVWIITKVSNNYFNKKHIFSTSLFCVEPINKKIWNLAVFLISCEQKLLDKNKFTIEMRFVKPVCKTVK